MQFSDFTATFMEQQPGLLVALPVTLVILAGALVMQLVLGRALGLLAKRTHQTTAELLPLRRLLRGVIWTVATILILGVYGFQLGGLWAILTTVLGLVAIGFVAVWSLLSHASATMLILFLRPYQVGDDIEFAGEPVRGRVIDLNFFFTTLIDHEGFLVQVPNNLFFQKSLKRRRNGGSVSLAAQLNSNLPAKVQLPPAPPEKEGGGERQKKPDPMLNQPDPRSIAPPSKGGR